MLELLSYPFTQRALIACLVVGFVASFFSAFVVQRRMSFLGAGLAHASFGGIALGLLLQIHPLWIAAPFTILVGLGINWLKENTKLDSDTAIGVFFAVAMALGIIFLSLRKQYSVDAMTYLFGSILAIQKTDLIFAVGFLILVLACLPLWKKWAYETFDRELARSDRLSVKSHDYVLTFLISLCVVVCLKILGIILLAAFLVIPGAAARMRSRTFFEMAIKSVVFGVSSSVAGLFLSYYLDVPSGAAIILLQAFLFMIAAIFRYRY